MQRLAFSTAVACIFHFQSQQLLVKLDLITAVKIYNTTVSLFV